jgi:type II secretory pathway component PulJ
MPELLIAIVILSVIIGPLVGALTVYMRNNEQTVARMSESHDIQLASFYFSRDIQSLGVRDLTTLQLVRSVNNTAHACDGPGDSIVLLAWDDPDPSTGNHIVSVNYLVREDAGGEQQLRRLECRDSVLQSDLVVVHNLDHGSRPSVSCIPAVSPPCVGGGGAGDVPRQVTLTLRVLSPDSDSDPVSVDLTGQRRQS